MFATPQAQGHTVPAPPPSPAPRALRKVALTPVPQGVQLGPARSELWLPRAALSACVRGVMARDTRGLELSPAQRYNHFPAAPTCALLWYLQGECKMLQPAQFAVEGGTRQRIPALSLCGPFTQPTISWNPGPMHAFMVLLMPDALHFLTGLDVAALQDRIVPAAQVLDASWQDFLEAVRTAADDDSRVALLEAFLLPRWRQVRPAGPLFSHHLGDWSRALALHAASSALGRSLRQAQRRIKRWTGQTQRDLQALQRSEQAFFNAVALPSTAPTPWADIAAQSGYADQAHLCRETRRVTGFAPEELRRRMFAEESLWAYRLWAFGLGAE